MRPFRSGVTPLVPCRHFEGSSAGSSDTRLIRQGPEVNWTLGYAQNSHLWRPLMAELALAHTVIAPDRKGPGHCLMEDAPDPVIPKPVTFLAA